MASLRCKCWPSQSQAIRTSLHIQQHATESPETAGSLGGRSPSDSLSSAQYGNPGLQLINLPGHLKEQGRDPLRPGLRAAEGC